MSLQDLLQAVDASGLGALEPLARQVLSMNPSDPDALHLLGMIAYQQKEYPQAIEYLTRAVEQKPNDSEIQHNLGIALESAQEPDAAIAAIQKALQLRPDWAEAHVTLASLFIKQGSYEAAQKHLDIAIAHDPKSAGAYNNYGIIHKEKHEWATAEDCFRKAIELDPNSTDAHNNLGVVLQERGKLDEAMAEFQKVIDLESTNVEAFNNMGTLFRREFKIDEAIDYYQKAIALKPASVEPYVNLAVTYYEKGDLQSAENAYQKLFEIDPNSAEGHKNLGMFLLSLGRWPEGWPEYEWRLKEKKNYPWIFPKPLWDGSSFSGKRLLVWADQGMGDALHFCRYLPWVKARGGEVILHCHPWLAPLMKNCEGVDSLISGTKSSLPPSPDDHDLYIPLLSLPHIFQTTLASIPSKVPYLFAPEDLVSIWANRISGGSKLNVGLAWKGNPHYKADQARSTTLDAFNPLRQIPGVQFVSLQKGNCTELEKKEMLAWEDALIDSTELLTDFAQTAALIHHLDLVIAVDTAVAHLAGAMGKPVWLLLPFQSDWRWLKDRTDTPWYPTMRLFRQHQRGDWQEAMARAQDELLKMAQS
jgi:type IV pilus biogenesis/stability protein PilW